MKQKEDKISAIILAGGLSSRMGSCKAELIWNGVPLIEHQVNKLRALGIDDIIISGYSKPVEDTRFVADKYLLKGPLGGIHAGLLAAKNPTCLVVGVDTPLLPSKVISELIQSHMNSSGNITVLAHGDKIEPIIAVYESWLARIAAQILMTDNTSIRVLLNKVGYSKYQFDDDEFLLCDCNTPEEFKRAAQITRSLA
ncbi:MAG: molybdenum cofactor guanylyltransferase [Bacillota bacterium]|nr:molybdenum cofactor guanylyltransferase [Bacillota bacterium]